MRCLTVTDVEALFEGELLAEQRQAIELHVDACDVCREFLGRYAQLYTSAAPESPSQEMPASHDGSWMPGERVGRYVVLERVGRGAMGAVYSAYDPELDRRVALKVLHPVAEADGDALRKLMLREARALARLSHPNVITVHDVGAIGDHTVLAMEFIDGYTLADWLAAKQPSAADIVETFRHAGEGLAAAHRAGLVHRDFKPTNVLVDREGRVKVTDFGMALSRGGATAQDTGECLAALEHATRAGAAVLTATLLDRSGALIGTPAYMAPEQLEGRASDARADQFAFCVALYEALTGHAPFAGRSLAELREQTRAHRVVPPANPSKVPARVHAVLLRGLQPDPERRWPDMHALLHALRPRGTRTRTVGAVGVGLLGLGLVANATSRTMADASEVCLHAERRIGQIWNETSERALLDAFARSGSSHADHASGVVTQALHDYSARWSDEAVRACQATHVHRVQSAEALELQMVCLEDGLRSTAALVSVLAAADAETVLHAISATGALPAPERCLDPASYDRDELRERARDAGDDNASIRDLLARAKALDATGNYAEAASAAGEALELARQGDAADLIAEAMFVRGHAQHDAGDGGAVASLQEAYYLARRARRPKQAAQAAALLAMNIAWHSNDAQQAERWTRLADVELEASSLHHDAALITRVDEAWAAVHEAENDHAAAADVLQRSVARLRGEGQSRHDLAISLLNFGNARFKLGQLTEAAASYDEGLELLEAELGSSHPTVAAAYGAAAMGMFAIGDARTMAAYAERGLDIAIRTQAPGSTVAGLHHTIGIAKRDLGAFRKASDHFARAVALHEPELPPSHPRLLTMRIVGAGTLRRLGRTAEALQVHDDVRKVLAAAKDDPSLSELRLLNDEGRARCLLSLRRFEAAEALARALELDEESNSAPEGRETNPQWDWSYHLLIGDIALARGRAEAAHTAYEVALASATSLFVPEHPSFGLTLARLGAASTALQSWDEARDALERAREVLRAKDADPAELGRIELDLARVAAGAGAEAERVSSHLTAARDGFLRSEAEPERTAGLAEVERWFATRLRP